MTLACYILYERAHNITKTNIIDIMTRCVVCELKLF